MNKFWDKNKIPLSIIIGAFIVGGFIYLSNQTKSKPTLQVDIQRPSPTAIKKAIPSLTSVPTAFSIPSPTTDDTAAIKKAMSAKIGVAEDKLNVTVSQNTGLFAKGLVKEKDAVGGGYFLAAKVNGNWVIVYDGQSQPPCSDLTAYNFPVNLAQECLNSSGKVVSR